MIEYLFHYYERTTGPFRNLSELAKKDALAVLGRLKADNKVMAAHRNDGYLDRRHELEALARSIFVEKGGMPKREFPHYMIVGECRWLRSWYRNGACVCIPLSDFDPNTLSFSYGDLFPTFSDRVSDGREYRRQVYTLAGIREVIRRYGLPQAWNPDGALGPERYVEVHVWDDGPLSEYLR